MPSDAHTSDSFDVDSDPPAVATEEEPEPEPDDVATKEESFGDSFKKEEILMLGKLSRALVPYMALAASS